MSFNIVDNNYISFTQEPPIFTIRTFIEADVKAVFELQLAYAQLYPGAKVLPGEFYLSPGFQNGANVFCALIDDRLVAYAPVYVQIHEEVNPLLPHVAWTEIKVHPDVADPYPIKDALLDCITQRAKEIAAPFPGRPTRLTFEYPASETPAREYVLSRGFQHTDSVFSMQRDLSQPIPAAAAPEGVEIRRWRMESEAEQRAYISAHNACLPESPMALPDWQYYMTSPMWAAGTMIAAFAEAELVGGVNVYWNEDESRAAPRPLGYTEDIFTLADWRGKGIARAMISEGMRYLKEHGLAEAHLGVRTLNEKALGLYRNLGYTVIQETRFYSKAI